jgi:allantoinase
VTPDRLLTRHKLTPYAGQHLSGVVRRTWLRGMPVSPGEEPAGRLLMAAAASAPGAGRAGRPSLADREP